MTIRRLMTGILEFEVVDTVSNDEIREFLDMLEEEAAEYQAGVIMDTTKRTGRSEHADIFAEHIAPRYAGLVARVAVIGSATEAELELLEKSFDTVANSFDDKEDAIAWLKLDLKSPSTRTA
jgi:hypothetical protein